MNFNFIDRDPTEIEDPRLPEGRISPDGNAFQRFVFAVAGKRQVFLTREEEAKLIRRWQDKKDKTALETLVIRFMPKIRATATNVARNSKCNHLLADLEQAGVVGFIEAVSKYEFDKDARLSTYSSYRIAGAMLHLVLHHKLPMRTGGSAGERRAFYQYRAAVEAFTKQHGRAPSSGPEDLAILAARTGVAPKAMARAYTTHHATVVPMHRVEVWTDAEEEIDQTRVKDILAREFRALEKTLSRRDYDITVSTLLKEGLSGNIASMADKYDITVERVRQIRRAALAEIRTSLASQGLTSSADFA